MWINLSGILALCIFMALWQNMENVLESIIFYISKSLWYLCDYRKNPKISDTQKFAVITLNVEQYGFSLE